MSSVATLALLNKSANSKACWPTFQRGAREPRLFDDARAHRIVPHGEENLWVITGKQHRHGGSENGQDDDLENPASRTLPYYFCIIVPQHRFG